jgi:hypothetical protein
VRPVFTELYRAPSPALSPHPFMPVVVPPAGGLGSRGRGSSKRVGFPLVVSNTNMTTYSLGLSMLKRG